MQIWMDFEEKKKKMAIRQVRMEGLFGDGGVWGLRYGSVWRRFKGELWRGAA